MTIEYSIYLAVFLSWLVNALMRQVKSFWLYSLISLPGTFLHELSHFLVGFFTRARPVSFTIFPRRIDNYWVFGSVGFTNLNSFNALPSSMAPLLILLFPWGVTQYVNVSTLDWYQLIGLFILIAVVTHSAIPSSQDFKVMLSKPLGLVLWGGVAYFFAKNYLNMG